MNNSVNKKDIELIERLMLKYDDTNHQVSNVIVGQKKAIKQILSTIFVGGHAWAVLAVEREVLDQNPLERKDLIFNAIVDACMPDFFSPLHQCRVGVLSRFFRSSFKRK